MLKRDGKPLRADAAEQNGAGGGDGESFAFRENDRINAQIDAYIKENPKHWEMIKAMPRERLERTVAWQQVRFDARRQKLDDGLLRKVEANPDLKRDYENLLKHVPENQRERAKVSIARTLVLSQSRGERQSKNAVGV
jgi:hypothetical protein